MSYIGWILPELVKRPLRMARDAGYEALALSRWCNMRRGERHDLPGELIVSLTSYPPRFSTLALTLACLCDQTVRADRIILWIADSDSEQLPNEVRWNMRQAGVEIRTCEDIGPYKKLVPALEAFPDAFIVTADDDDVYYHPRWLEILVSGNDGGSIVCTRAHRIKAFMPYRQWQLNVSGIQAPAADLLPVGVGGILYPPHSLHPTASDRRFIGISPKCDDLWFYWMGQMAGTKVKKVGHQRRVQAWAGSQDCALWNVNEHGGNDEAVANLVKAFGALQSRPAVETDNRAGSIISR